LYKYIYKKYKSFALLCFVGMAVPLTIRTLAFASTSGWKCVEGDF